MYFANVGVVAAANRHPTARAVSRPSIHLLVSPIILSRLIVWIAFLSQIFVAWRFWHVSWDDSAITLGFARTFALTGRIEPTPGSGIVEGYSTTLWMLLMTAAAKFFVSPSALLAAAKISTLLCNLANILLLRSWFRSWTGELLANLIVGVTGCSLMFYETINGMEAPLMLTLLCVMLLLLASPSRSARLGYLLAGSAFLLVRWEAIWLLIPFLLVESRRSKAFGSALTWISVLAASNLVRWLYFGHLLPNTIIAKRGEPYSTIHHLEVHRHLNEPLTILSFCAPLLCVTFLVLLQKRYASPNWTSLIASRYRSVSSLWQFRFTVLFVLFSLVLSTAIGKNYGPPVRSFYCGWPFLLCLILIPIILNLTSRLLAWATLFVCLFSLTHLVLFVRELHRKDAPVYMPYITIDYVARMNNLLARIQSLSHRSQLVYAGPDMGGILLYSNGIQVIDLGRLCDATLAHQRYQAINSYVLQKRRPDVIEVHEIWTTLTRLQEYPLFINGYRPVFVDKKRLFLRNDLLQQIDATHLIERRFRSDGHPIDPELDSPGYPSPDLLLNQRFGSYLILH
jgi:hypothetical protein